MENYFLFHRWAQWDMSFALYTEKELLKIDKSLGHPSTRGMTGLLRRASDVKTLDSTTRESLEAIRQRCDVYKKAGPVQADHWHGRTQI